MRLVSIASGSSGNCIYAGTENTHILIDAGISNKRIEQGLNDIGVKGSELDGVFITHEHSDHVKGLGVLARKHGVPIYATEETIEEIKNMKYLGQYPKELFRPVLPDVEVLIGDMEVKPFSIDHDAANPVAYRIQSGQRRAAVATDMGHFDQYIIEHLQGLDALLLESNHDVRMLETGPYPYYLKRRILSDHGHLSNDNAGRLLNYILHDDMKHILLGHLSKENNFEELAYETVKLEIDQGDCGYRSGDFAISVASRDAMSQIITI
ncbi:MAG: MBL fold metallo-hydrolase [Hungatella sp.]|nr:MBL fold metallo-hydrolase [Hungatella sp.]